MAQGKRPVVQIPAKMVTDDNGHDDDDDDDEDDDDTHDSDFLTRTRMVTRLVMTGLVQSPMKLVVQECRRVDKRNDLTVLQDGKMERPQAKEP